MGLRHSSDDDMPVLNLTSMIDVLMLLIIFFVVGTKFIDDERQISLKLPKVASSAGPLTAPPQNRVVTVYKDGAMTLDGEQVTLEQLTAKLKSAKSQYAKQGATLRMDGQLTVQIEATVLEACRQAGITDFSLTELVASAEKGHARK
jgi:biopolymer transport protein ExbD